MNNAGRSRNARLNQASKHVDELQKRLARLCCLPSDTHIDQKDSWHDARNALEQLTQCFHEANAYNNLVPVAQPDRATTVS